MRWKRFALVLLVAGGCWMTGGCFYFVSTYKTSEFVHGSRPVSEKTLDRIEPGKTTRDWVLSVLGPPTSLREAGSRTEILAYETRMEVLSRSHVFLFYHGTQREETISTVYIEVENGVVRRTWRDAG